MQGKKKVQDFTVGLKRVALTVPLAINRALSSVMSIVCMVEIIITKSFCNVICQCLIICFKSQTFLSEIECGAPILQLNCVDA